MTGRAAVQLNSGDDTGHTVPIRKFPARMLFSRLPLDNLIFGDDRVPVEITSLVPNGSIVIGIGEKDRRYYIVNTIDVVYAAYQADRALRNSVAKQGE